MRKLRLILLCILLAICGVTGCSSEVNKITIEQTTQTGALSDFNLLTPTLGQTCTSMPLFSWEESTNASYYDFELCSTSDFNQSDLVYLKKTGIVKTSVRINATIRQKNETYYWRVTAKNSSGSKLCQSIGAFYFATTDVGEIEIPIAFADEWERHELGSYADISIDKSNYFGNDKDSLKITFEQEQTNQGIPESDGWIVVTKTQEMELYGVDAIKFNFYYSGDDAQILVRMIDEDNEYWQAKIQVAGNERQTVIIKFSEFTLRTAAGTSIANEVFDYNYIKAIDFTFEKSFGDGVALFNDLRAVKYSDYSHLFITKIDFSRYTNDDYVFEQTSFVVTPSEDGSSVDISYPNMSSGYGFAKLYINSFITGGDAFRFKLKYYGSTSYDDKATILLRVIEEDNDRWLFKTSAASCRDEGLTFVIPFSAFTLHEFNGDGTRQFNYIKQFQFGIQNVYGSGGYIYEDFEVVRLEDVKENLYHKVITGDGIIDNFENYANPVDIYYTWLAGLENKDETLSCDSLGIYGKDNTSYGVLTYKSDMSPASYGMYLEVPANFNALTLTMKDDSSKSGDVSMSYLDSVTAKMVVNLYLSTGERFYYTVPALTKEWTNYTISFSDFVLSSEFNQTQLTSENIAGIQIDLQYFYYTSNGSPAPQYIPSNKVYIDDVKFTNAGSTVIAPVLNKIMPDSEDPNVCVIDNFNDYEALVDLTSEWVGEGLSIGSSYNSSSSMVMTWDGEETSAVNRDLVFDSSINKGRALSIAMNGDGTTKVYVDITFIYSNKTYVYRAEIKNVNEGWYNYIVGFDKFTKLEGTGSTVLSAAQIKNITNIKISASSTSSAETHTLMIDDIMLSAHPSATTNTRTSLED